MKVISHYPGIKSIQFLNSTILFVHLDDDRTFLIPLYKFPVLKNLSAAERNDFEIIDDRYLSFLTIYEVFSLEELTGIGN